MSARRPYEPQPRYAPAGGSVVCGWEAALASLPATAAVLALDGPAILHWEAAVARLTDAAAARDLAVDRLDLRACLAPWEHIVERTTSPELPDDPDFTRLAEADLVDLFETLPDPQRPDAGLLVVFGPGASLVAHDVLWYADLPKRYAEAAINAGTALNLGQPPEAGPGTTRRLFYVDWPILDRHRDALAAGVDRWLDLQEPADPASIDGPTLLRTLGELAHRPFRTRPTFNTATWGGHWGQRQLGLGREAANTGIGYELIAPESGILIGDGSEAQIEVPFSLAVTQHATEILGEEVRAEFGASFPIRFDYLDTVDGGNLSVHCHPQADYMRRVFGWPYTQHESYYVMVGGAGRRVYLGLREDRDLGEFEAAAQSAVELGRPFEIEHHVQTFPAEPHQLFMIPAGTPHGSGEGNVILEVSATPYLYSLRFYDWLRRDAQGNQRPVHVGHAFANLNRDRRGEAVRADLVQSPRTVASGPGWRDELIGALPEVFFEVQRSVLDTDAPVTHNTGGRFWVLNVVDGDGIAIETSSGAAHALNYAETMVIPAAVGPYTVRRLGSDPVRVVKARVRPR